jgi:hypothetical protein
MKTYVYFYYLVKRINRIKRMATLTIKQVMEEIPFVSQENRPSIQLIRCNLERGWKYLAIKRNKKGKVLYSKFIIFNRLEIISYANITGDPDDIRHDNIYGDLVVVVGSGLDEEELDDKFSFYREQILYKTNFIRIPGTNFVLTQIADEKVILLEVSNDKIELGLTDFEENIGLVVVKDKDEDEKEIFKIYKDNYRKLELLDEDTSYSDLYYRIRKANDYYEKMVKKE